MNLVYLYYKLAFKSKMEAGWFFIISYTYWSLGLQPPWDRRLESGKKWKGYAQSKAKNRQERDPLEQGENCTPPRHPFELSHETKKCSSRLR